MPQQGGQCPYCQLIDNPQQLLTVGETDNFYAWLEIQPRARGHTQVVPKEHVADIYELSAERYLEMMKLVREVMEKAREGLGADGVSVTMNVKESGGQMLPHAYISVFPRFEDEENAGTPTGAIFPQKEELQQELEGIQASMEGVTYSFEGKKHEPHPEGEEFKEESEIDQMLDSGLGDPLAKDTGSETDRDEEAGIEEPEDGSEEVKSQESDEVEIDQVSDQEMLKRLIERHGGVTEFLKSQAMSSVVEKADMELVERKERSRKSSFDWR